MECDQEAFSRFDHGSATVVGLFRSPLSLHHWAVDWKKMFNLQTPCPSCKTTTLSNDRANFSKNKMSFPMFVLDGPRQWCMVMSMKCNKCKARFDSNNSEILCNLLAHAMSAYPVDRSVPLATTTVTSGEMPQMHLISCHLLTEMETCAAACCTTQLTGLAQRRQPDVIPITLKRNQ